MREDTKVEPKSLDRKAVCSIPSTVSCLFYMYLAVERLYFTN